MYAKAKVSMAQRQTVAHACMRQTDTRHVNAPASTGSQRLTVLLPERNAHTI
jgi:hypothetical protein